MPGRSQAWPCHLQLMLEDPRVPTSTGKVRHSSRGKRRGGAPPSGRMREKVNQGTCVACRPQRPSWTSTSFISICLPQERRSPRTHLLTAAPTHSSIPPTIGPRLSSLPCVREWGSQAFSATGFCGAPLPSTPEPSGLAGLRQVLQGGASAKSSPAVRVACDHLNSDSSLQPLFCAATLFPVMIS